MEQQDFATATLYTIGTVRAAGPSSSWIGLVTDVVAADGNGTRSFGPGWSADGRRIVYHSIDKSGPNWRHRICTVPAAGGPSTTIWRSIWLAQPPDMGAPELQVRISAVDGSRF